MGGFPWFLPKHQGMEDQGCNVEYGNVTPTKGGARNADPDTRTPTCYENDVLGFQHVETWRDHCVA